MKNYISNIAAGIIAAILVAILQMNSAPILESINAASNPVVIVASLVLIMLGICIGWLLRGLFSWRPKQKIINNDVNDHNRETICTSMRRTRAS